MKTKKVKAWAIINKNEKLLSWCKSETLGFAVIKNKGAAKEYIRDWGTDSWKIVPCEIIINLPKKK